MEKSEIENYKKAGQISIKAKEYARQLIKPGMSLLDIAEKIENKIIELGGGLAFPINLSINDIAAHYTPSSYDETEASGLLKVDLGVHINGAIADTAFSIDLTKDNRYKKLIEASELALDAAIKTANKKAKLSELGSAIHEQITKAGFSPIRNLSGHKLGLYEVHAGLTIPNYDNNNQTEIGEGAYAIEPFSTPGQGIVYDGGKSGIYKIESDGNARDATARKMLQYIKETYNTMPFCERWLAKEFGSRARISLHFLEQAGILHHYPQLVEKSRQPVSQAEHTILILENKTEVTTR